MTVYTYGVFDLFHVGHLQLLEEAKALGDELIVGVFTDEVAEVFKRKPIVPLAQRIRILNAIKCVDKVVIQDDILPSKNVFIYSPAIVAKGPGARWTEEGPDFKIDAKVVVLPYHNGVSTTEIIKNIHASRIK